MSALTAVTARRAALAGLMRPAHLLILVVTAAIGFLLVGQLRDTPDPSLALAAESEGDLARILAGLNSEADALQSELADLKLALADQQRSSQSEAAAMEAANDQLRTLQVLAGTVPVTGPGVTLTITDPAASITYDVLIDVVQELRDAGAEAVAVNNQRLGVAAAFGEREGRITLNDRTLEPPYIVQAIGQPATLDGGLKIPGGAQDAMTALRSVKVEVARQARVDIPALSTPPVFSEARPVGSRP